jgi:class 3 adenylate cyclase
MTELPDGTVTLLFSDIEGSTALLKRLGDGWPAVLERQRSLLREAIAAGDGVVVDCQGDAMFAAFRSAPAGVAAAVRAQTDLAREEWPDGTAVRVRMALHTGEPHRTDDGGYTGIDVVRAARLCAAGHGGQVLLTEAARLVSGAATIDLGPATLPDMDQPERVHQLSAPGLAASFPPLRSQAASPLETLEHGPDDLEGRIDRAEKTLERRINERVAGVIERALDAPFGKPGGRGKRR